MKNIKIKVISAVLASIFVVASVPEIVKAEPKTINYVADGDMRSIDIMEIATALGANVENNNGNIKININGKDVSFNENGSFISIDGQVIALKVEEVEVFNSNDKYKLPIPKKIKNDDGIFLVPVEILNEYLGLEYDDNGVIINENNEVLEETPIEDATINTWDENIENSTWENDQYSNTIQNEIQDAGIIETQDAGQDTGAVGTPDTEVSETPEEENSFIPEIESDETLE